MGGTYLVTGAEVRKNRQVSKGDREEEEGRVRGGNAMEKERAEKGGRVRKGNGRYERLMEGKGEVREDEKEGSEGKGRQVKLREARGR